MSRWRPASLIVLGAALAYLSLGVALAVSGLLGDPETKPTPAGKPVPGRTVEP